MAEIVGVAAATAATIEQSLRFMQRISTAVELHKKGDMNLESISADLASTTQAIELVDAQPDLKTKCVLAAVASIEKVAARLVAHVERVKTKSTTGSQLRQFTHQFMKGPGEWETMATMIANLTAAKATLSLHIQMTHVGLSVVQDGGIAENSPCNYLVNSKILETVNQAVERKLGKGRGLKIAEVFRDKKVDADGMIRLTKEEYDTLPLSEFDDGDGTSQSLTVRVMNNCTYDQALQINHLVGEETWGKLTQNLIIENNEARHLSIQVNAPITDGTFDKLLAARAQTVSAMGGGMGSMQSGPYGGWPPPPPMPGITHPQMIGSQGQQAVPPWAFGSPATDQSAQVAPQAVSQFGMPARYASYGQWPQQPYWGNQGPQGYWSTSTIPQVPPDEEKPAPTTGNTG